jgi:NaMN:DMB phosphoribosyltransferase
MMKKMKWFGVTMLLALTIGFASSAAAVTAEQIEECANDPEKLVALVDGLSTAEKASVVAGVLKAIAATYGTDDARFARVLDIALNDLGVGSTAMASALGSALFGSPAVASRVSSLLQDQNENLFTSFLSAVDLTRALAARGNPPPVDVIPQQQQQQNQQQQQQIQQPATPTPPPVGPVYPGQGLS